MGALTIAFDTTLVGALALPWVILIIHLFFAEGENRLSDLLKWVQDQQQPAVTGVILFAMTYTLGSAVSRIAFDFFNDDDIHVEPAGRLLRIGVTEDRLHTSVYCRYRVKNRNRDKEEGYDNSYFLKAKPGDDAIAATMTAFKAEQAYCWQNLKWWVNVSYGVDDGKMNQAAADLFGLQENQLLLKGEDPTMRLRQLHDQIMVLRGAAFNGVLTFSLCWFALAAKFRRERTHSRLRFVFVPLPLLYMLVTFLAIYHHFEERMLADPPYMEFTLVLLSLAGAWLVWRAPQPAPVEPPGTVTPRKPVNCEHWGCWTVVAGLLMIAAALGWWSTETLYTTQVIYSYNAQGATQK